MANSDEEMVALRARARQAGVTAMWVADRGPPEAKAVLALGPVPAAALDALMGGLERM